jgi:hypothetical protein
MFVSLGTQFSKNILLALMPVPQFHFYIFLYFTEMKLLTFSFDNKRLHQILVGSILNLKRII